MTTNNNLILIVYFLAMVNAFMGSVVFTTQSITYVQILWVAVYITLLISSIYYILVSGIPSVSDASDATAPTQVVVFTDEGEESDDRLGIHFLMSNNTVVPGPHTRVEYTFVFVGTAELSADDCLTMWFDKFHPESSPHWNTKNTARFTTLNDFRTGQYLNYDWALQIAPLADYDGANLSITNKYILAGDADPTKNSVNRKKSCAIIQKFKDADKLIDISSDHMATMRFQPELLNKFKGMHNFMESIVFFAFKLAIARMRYDHPVAAAGVAEGLVNPGLGRGTNYKSVKMIHEILMAKDNDGHGGRWPSPREVERSSRAAATKYFRNVYGCPAPSSVELSQYGADCLSHRHSLKCLTEINECLSDIHYIASGHNESRPVLFNEHPEVFYSNFDQENIPEILIPMWELFKENQEDLIPAFNPVYDLFAAFVLVGEMNGISRSTYTPDQFTECICTEFA
jgi:hypothetical protein